MFSKFVNGDGWNSNEKSSFFLEVVYVYFYYCWLGWVFYDCVIWVIKIDMCNIWVNFLIMVIVFWSCYYVCFIVLCYDYWVIWCLYNCDNFIFMRLVIIWNVICFNLCCMSSCRSC